MGTQRRTVIEHLEVWGPQGRDLVALEGDRLVLGTAPDCDVVLGDETVSRVHAVLSRLPATWTVRDISSRNGTYVNGRRIIADCPLHVGDEVRLGRTRILLRGARGPAGATAPLAEPPRLTERERDVLIALCRPLAGAGAFPEPAGVREIATALTVTDAAVKHHLANLFEKFGIGEGPRRRARLANAALTSGAVGMADLRSPA